MQIVRSGSKYKHQRHYMPYDWTSNHPSHTDTTHRTNNWIRTLQNNTHNYINTYTSLHTHTHPHQHTDTNTKRTTNYVRPIFFPCPLSNCPESKTHNNRVFVRAISDSFNAHRQYRQQGIVCILSYSNVNVLIFVVGFCLVSVNLRRLYLQNYRWRMFTVRFDSWAVSIMLQCDWNPHIQIVLHSAIFLLCDGGNFLCCREDVGLDERLNRLSDDIR